MMAPEAASLYGLDAAMGQGTANRPANWVRLLPEGHNALSGCKWSRRDDVEDFAEAAWKHEFCGAVC